MRYGSDSTGKLREVGARHKDSAMAEHCKMNNKHILNLQTVFSSNEYEE